MKKNTYRQINGRETNTTEETLTSSSLYDVYILTRGGGGANYGPGAKCDLI